MERIQYLVNDKGEPVAVQIPIARWRAIEAKLAASDDEAETQEIAADPAWLDRVRRGREDLKAGRVKALAEVKG